MFPLFPFYAEHWLDDVIAELCYHPHSVGGLSFTPDWIEQLTIDRIDYYIEWLDKRRKAEIAAIKKNR